jgi:pimeloyl-ACP methyl ester carboxylesterase
MLNRFAWFLSAIVFAALLAPQLAAGAVAVIAGVVDYSPPADEAKVPERFRLAAHSFEFQQKALPRTSTDIEKFEVTFPSPVKTEHEENNTVHCEYFRPIGPEKSPGVIVLHILGGDFELSRAFCQALSHRGAAALFVKMPYYGPRRPPGQNRRMIAVDPRDTVAGMTQAILDIRRAVAWLGAQEEIDAERLGVFGISLGGITGALAATAEPRLTNVCLLLAGGDIGQVGWESPELAGVRKAWLDQGGTREEFFALMSQIDPAAYGENVRGRRILMLNAERDEVIPKSCTESLWKSFGEPEIEWYPGGHYSVIWKLFSGINRVTRFFVESP